MKFDSLIAYLQDHGIEARLHGSKIQVTDEWTKDGKAFAEPKLIQPTVSAVRDFLGY
jgi:hypothetical protein